MSSQSVTQFRLEQKFQARLYIYTGGILLIFALFTIQLGNLQLVWGFENNILAKRFVSRQEFSAAPRGLMFDRNYTSAGFSKPLVQNRNYIDYIIFPSRFENREEGLAFIKKFSYVMGRPFEEYSKYTTERAWDNLVNKNMSITMLTRISRKEHERLAEFRMVTRYGDFISNHLRYYTMGPAMAHVAGYIGLPSRGQLDKKQVLSYQYIGKNGLESMYDQEVRGRDGIRLKHRIIEQEEQISSTEHGNNLVLTIDREVQAAGYRAIVNAGKRATAIAMNAGTGEILALVSFPSYDPNLLSSGTGDQRSNHYKTVMEYEGFLNLAIQAKFPPASTFKPIVALAGMEGEQRKFKVDENTSFNCPGRFILRASIAGAANTEFWCWNTSGHGTLNLLGSLQNSCNVYYYNLGSRIGPTAITQFARSLGLDKKTGIDLPGEIEGFVPSQRWKQLRWSSRWYDGDTVNLAIGQGFLETTPMGMAVALSAIVNRGKIFRPHLVREIRDPMTDRVIRKINPELVRELPLNPDSLALIQKGLRLVVTSGTGRSVYRPDMVPMAGKTGTAQTASKQKGKSHAWFIGFAPYEGLPEETVVVVVFVEHGKAGGLSAAPIATEMLRAAFPKWTGPKATIRGEDTPSGQVSGVTTGPERKLDVGGTL